MEGETVLGTLMAAIIIFTILIGVTASSYDR
jgi:hypothetical protein